MENRISVTIPAKVLAEALTKLKELQTLLEPYTADVTAEQKNSLLKIGDKTVPFIDKTVSYTESAGEFSPVYLDATELKKDNEALKALNQLYRPAEQLLQMIADTRALAGNDAYSASLVYYNAVKQASSNGIAKAKSIYDDLSQRFPGKPRKTQASLSK